MTKLSTNDTASVEIKGKQYNTFTEPPVALQQERDQTDFPVQDLTNYVYGGKEMAQTYKSLMDEIERTPAFSNDDFYDVDKEKRREITMDRVAWMGKKLTEAVSQDETSRLFSLVGLVDGNTTTRTGVHYGLFFSTVRANGSPAQLNYWTQKGASTLRKFFGCFALTEMGHGSATAMMETTAHFDEKTDEFIINTPTVAATKWWIGGAAHSATHSICWARLIVKGKDHGVKPFVVPMRNPQDHELLPGVACGDIGKKMGRDGIDNGWIQYTNVKIPRQFMLMKYTQVDREGNVTAPPNAQLQLSALVAGRVSMAADSAVVANRFLTIAIRYAAIRRQFSSTPGEPESKILDYTYHQRRLIPRLAYSFAMQAASRELYKISAQANENLEAAIKDKSKMASAINDAKELFTASAGLKAFCTWATADIIDECRQACGGHGYSGYNGFGQGYNDWVVQCTWEGDNNVLTLSTGRSLIQSGLSAKKGKPLGNSSSYLSRAKELAGAKLNGRDITDPKVLTEAWEAASARGIMNAADSFINLTENKGLNPTQAFEELSQQRFEIARIHTRQYLIKCFFQSIESAEASVKPVLTDLATLFALWSLETDSASFLVSGYLQASDVDKITTLVNEYNKKIRKNVIGITDSFNMSDFFINAPIGSYDGNAYEHYFSKVLRRNPNQDSKPAYYESKMRPFLFRPEDEEVDVTELEDE